MADLITDIERFSFSLTGASSGAQSVSSVDLDNCAAYVTMRCSTDMGDIIEDDTVSLSFNLVANTWQLDRTGTTGTMEVEIVIVEYDTAQITMQYVTFSMGTSATTQSVTINSVTDITNAYAVHTFRSNATGSEDDWASRITAVWLSSTTAVDIERGEPSNSTGIGDCWIVEADDGEFDVQHLNPTYSATSTPEDTTITAVVMALTQLIDSQFSSKSTDDTRGNSHTHELTSTTNVQQAWFTGTASGEARIQVVEYATDKAAIDRGSSSSTAASFDVTPASFDVTRSFPKPPNAMFGSAHGGSTDDHVEQSYVSMEYVSADIRVQRSEAITGGFSVFVTWENAELADQGAPGAVIPVFMHQYRRRRVA